VEEETGYAARAAGAYRLRTLLYDHRLRLELLEREPRGGTRGMPPEGREEERKATKAGNDVEKRNKDASLSYSRRNL